MQINHDNNWTIKQPAKYCKPSDTSTPPSPAPPHPVTDTFLLTFSLRVSYVTGHWSVTGRSAGQRVVCGLVARLDVGFVWAVWPERCYYFFLFLSAILVCVM